MVYWSAVRRYRIPSLIVLLPSLWPARQEEFVHRLPPAQGIHGMSAEKRLAGLTNSCDDSIE